ncbi:hypothetical protein HN873_047872 [Arachis hypogaea]
MDFDLYSSDNDEESSEMSLGVCGSLGPSDDDDNTGFFWHGNKSLGIEQRIASLTGGCSRQYACVSYR